jgi:transposase
MIYRREDVHQMEFSCARDEVAAEQLVLTIDDVVEQLDLRALHARYSEAGMGYYDPGMMLKVWFFAYCDGSWHCREVAKRVRYDVRYRYFVGSHRPDFRTLNRFRKDHLDLLPDYFVQLLSYCERLGLIDSSVVALDGTKLRANASGRRRAKDSLRRQIKRRLAQDVSADEIETEATTDAGAGAGEGTAHGQAVSATDPEAQWMKTGEGTVRLCYNGQVVVDNQQFIVAADVTNEANERSALAPLLEQAESHLSTELGAIVADAGYYSGQNMKCAQERSWDVYIPQGLNERGVFSQEQFVYDQANDRYRCPNGQWLKRGSQRERNGVVKITYQGSTKQCRGCPLKTSCTKDSHRRLEIAETHAYQQAVAAKLASPHGQAIYARRRELVEPVFGNLKFNLGFTRFSLRGLAQVRGEFLLLCIAHNLKKLARWQGYHRVQAAFLTVLELIIVAFGRCLTHLTAFPPSKKKMLSAKAGICTM